MESPLVRGGAVLAAGIFTGTIIGFFRVALTAYLLGTHSRADSLAVALGPVDTLNSMLTTSMIFAFVPMLTACSGSERIALFLKLRAGFMYVFPSAAVVVIAVAPWLMRLLAPGLAAESFDHAVEILRILTVSTAAAGIAALYWALLYTERRFGPTAFYQATLNAFTVIAALALWKQAGVYAFAIGYATGACVQLAFAHFTTRPGALYRDLPACPARWPEILAKPAPFLIYASGLALNITFTRAYATQAGAGMAAALDYCLRGVGVPMALLVSPLANSLLPEIAHLRPLRLREAFRLIDRTVALAALIALVVCGIALWLRQPGIALLFQRGSFTAESTQLVSAVYLGLGPSLVGWSLLEIMSRSLFALERPWPAVVAAFLAVAVNVVTTLLLSSVEPQFLGLGATVGTLSGFLFLFLLVRVNRGRWLAET